MPSASGSAVSIGHARRLVRSISVEGGRPPFIALQLFTFLLIVAPQEQFPMLSALHLPFVAACFAVASYGVDRLSRGAPLTVSEPEIRLVLLLLALAVLSVPTSYYPGGSVATIRDLFAKSIIIFLLVANVLTSAQRLRAMVWLLALCSTVPAVAVIRNYRAGNVMQAEGSSRIQGYAGSLSSNPNDLALVLNLIIPLAVGLLLCTPRFSHRVLLGLVIFLGVGGVIVTQSRAGFIYLVTNLVLHVTYIRKLRIWMIPITCALLLYMSGVAGFFDRMETIGDVSTPGSAHERWENMKKAASLMMAHPLFGVGIGQNMQALNTMGTFWGHVHSVYLEIGAELGVPALIVFLLLLRHCLRSAKNAAQIWRAQGAKLYHLAQGLRISLIGFAIAVNFYPVSYHFPFYYLAGLAVAMKVVARKQLRRPTALRPAS